MKFISPLDRRARKEFCNFFVDMIIGLQNVSFGSSSEILQILFVAMIHDLLDNRGRGGRRANNNSRSWGRHRNSSSTGTGFNQPNKDNLFNTSL